MIEEDLRQLADWIAKLIEAADGDLAEKLEGGPLCHLRAVMNDPAWQAITPEVVRPENHAPAVALNSVGFNVARAFGPALGGLVIAAAGSGVAFLLNAASFFGVIFFVTIMK